MIMKKVVIAVLVFLPFLISAASCSEMPKEVAQSGEEATIFPDYKDVTVPENIAPLNFEYTGSEPCALSVDGKVLKPRRGGRFVFGRKLWKDMMSRDSVEMSLSVLRGGKWVSFKPFKLFVSRDRIDPWISYRLIPPGYQGWQKMGIFQRDLTSYSQKAIITNDLTGGNCMNCHTYCGNDPSRMVFHVRSSFGGTIIAREGMMEKLNTKTDSTISALVYPYWHPSGDYIAFSVNKTLQAFHNHDANRIEVYDEASDVVVYDVRNHTVTWSPLTKSEERFETFPTFSPDGKWLYFCSSEAVAPMPEKHKEAKYGLYRIAFDPENCTFSDSLECVYDAPAEGASVSFPRISPDGRFLCFTRHGYGNFSIWHKDADLWTVDLSDGTVRPMEQANSDDVDSFHTWSSDGRWLVFSSRRDDGLYTRPYFCHVDSSGNAAKPFLLPQRDPGRYYKKLMESYNLPAFTVSKVGYSKRSVVNTIRGAEEIPVGIR